MNLSDISMDTILMLLPLVALQLGLAIYCAVLIFKEGVQNLNRWIWLAICLLGSLIGSVTFLIVGRKKGSA